MFGGTSGGDETWLWNGAGWTLAANTGPAARTGAALAYDRSRRVIVLFGGRSGSAYLNDTWEWNGIVWRQVASTGPPPRSRHAMTYDAARRVTVLFGGEVSAWQGAQDTWEWDGAAWTQRIVPSQPSPRFWHAMAYDESRAVTVLFGGFQNVALGDTWEWDGTEWIEVENDVPPSRRFHAMAYDSARGVTVMFGGDDGRSTIFDETWEWSGVEWTMVAENGPTGRTDQAMTFDSTRAVLVQFGAGETWEFDCTRITLTVAGTCPSGGPVRIEWSGAPPETQAALIYSRTTGSFVIPNGRPCAGTRLGLGTNQIQVAWQGSSGPNGARVLNTTAPPAACGGYLQLLVLPSCNVSNVGRIE